MLDISDDRPSLVPVKGTRRKLRITGIKPYTIERLTRLWVEREELLEAEKGEKENESAKTMRSLSEDPYFAAKQAALIWLNGWWKINLLYPLVWRIWAYLRGWGDAELAGVIMEGKKKTSAHAALDGYGVYRGYESGLDEPDGKGSRAIPSRTPFGRESAFCKDFPEYAQTRRFFFGLIEVRHWGYRCMLTLPQIEIMMADLPHTLYRTGKEKPEIDPDDPAFELTRRSAERQRARMKETKKEETDGGVALDDIFSGKLG